MKELLGKKILHIFVSEGEYLLSFHTDEGIHSYETEGDCCSESWFSDIIGTQALLNAIVISAEDIDINNYNTEDGRGRQESDQVYGIKMMTTKGYADIMFRNSSNGYYGGWCGYAKDKTEENMVEITTDWVANEDQMTCKP